MRKKYVEAMLAAKDAELNAQLEDARADRALARERLKFEKQQHEDNLRVKDRADVSLHEYEKMKHLLETLELQVKQYENLLFEIKLDSKIVKAIVPDTVQALSVANIKNCTTMVRIEFEYDPLKLI